MNFLAATSAKPVRDMDAEMQSLQEKLSVIVSSREARQERIATKVAAIGAKPNRKERMLLVLWCRLNIKKKICMTLQWMRHWFYKSTRSE